jgi:hypothetical protein
MKLLIIIIFLPIIVFCQENRIYLDIKIDGVKIKAIETELKRNIDSINSKLILPIDSGSFNINNQKEGQWIEYSIDSMYSIIIKSTGIYHTNRKMGLWLEYSNLCANNSNSWQINRTTEYKKGRIHGFCYIFGDSPDDTAIIVHYRNDRVIELTEKLLNEKRKRKRIYKQIWIEKYYDMNGTLLNKEWFKE